MKKIIDVSTGEVRTSRRKVILRSSAIGSCVAVAAYDSEKKVGALAHVMLPGSAPRKAGLGRTKYAVDAVKELLKRMAWRGTNKADIEVVLVGGGNVLRKKDDTICRENIESVVEVLAQNQIPIQAQSVGGTTRRSVTLDVETGQIFCSQGDMNEKELWEPAVNDPVRTIIPILRIGELQDGPKTRQDR